MDKIMLVLATFAVAGCATPGLQTSLPEVDHGPAVGQDAEELRASDVMRNADFTDEQTPVGEHIVARNDDGMDKITGIEDIESPGVSETPAELIPNRPQEDPSIVCERVRPTGSIIPVKVCKHVGDAERKGEYDREMFDDIKRGSALGGARANTNSSIY